jgi:hypothetical protein
MPMPDKTKAKVIMVVITIVSSILAVAAVVFIVVGVLSHEETVRLKACWETNRAVYIEPGDDVPPGCIPIDVVWGWSPLDVGLYSYNDNPPEPWQIDLTIKAVDEVNKQVGRNIFRFDVVGDASDIDVIWNVPLEGSKTPLEGVQHYRFSGNLTAGYAKVNMSGRGDQDVLYRALLHGLGHAVGLGHDHDNRRSIMYPLQPDFGLLDDPAWFTDVDCEELRENGP